MLSFTATTGRTAVDLSQWMGLPLLEEEHSHKRAPASQAFGASFRLVAYIVSKNSRFEKKVILTEHKVGQVLPVEALPGSCLPSLQ